MAAQTAARSATGMSKAKIVAGAGLVILVASSRECLVGLPHVLHRLPPFFLRNPLLQQQQPVAGVLIRHRPQALEHMTTLFVYVYRVDFLNNLLPYPYEDSDAPLPVKHPWN